MPSKERGTHRSPISTPPTSPKPFAAARPTVASLNKQRLPTQPAKYKSPTDNKCKTSPPSRPSSDHEINQRRNTSDKPRWVSTIRIQSIPPLPAPPPKKPKAHEAFKKRLRKVLPPSKILERSPRDVYVPIERIGSGTNGAVMSAIKRNKNSLSTAKRNKKSLVALKRCYIQDNDHIHHAYVLRELRIMGCMSHPNIVSLSEACVWGDHLWMAMELMTCSVFGLLFNMTVPLPESYAVRIAHEVLQGLVFLHGRNYIHRDVKCENILLDQNGQVKLADFGLATPANKENTAQLGTAKWMAPEVVAESAYSETVDIWSLGITIIEMMDRVPPLYYLDSPREIFAEILSNSPPNFNFAMPSAAMARLIGWILEPCGNRRPGAKCVLTHIRKEVESGALQSARQTELAALVQLAFPNQK
ncbi:kinase-like domain-containing protein [Dichotomocladium elegans]|nr:kinase-like domain-containing protein [Dichotomocladium elegans]